jgi:hypothetical protein
MVDAAEVADTMIFLCAATGITGQTVQVDCGRQI